MTFKMMITLVAVGVTLLLSFALVPLVKKIAFKVDALDYPNNRKVHTMPTPRLGGIGIVVSFYVGIFIVFGFTQTAISIIFPSMFVVLAGILDDIFTISPKVKLFLQFMGALVFVSFGGNHIISFFMVEGQQLPLNELSLVITVLWLIGASNAVNLIDGLDGLAGGVSLISSLSLGLLCILIGNNTYGIVTFILAASILGFLKYNFYPASIFMGDTGALFLGFILGELAILGALKGATFISFILPILILGIPILDTVWSIIRRVLSGKPIMNADKNHFHHRLLNRGFSHRQTVLFIYCISAILGVTAVLASGISTINMVIVVVVVVVIILLLFAQMGLFSKTDSQKANGSMEEEKEE